MLIPGLFVLPPLLLVHDGFNFFESVQLAAVDAGAAVGGHVPLVRCMQVKRPERPGAALVRSYRIDRTAAAAVFHWLEKNAVLGLFIFLDAVLKANPLEVLLLYLVNRQAQMLGQQLNLFFDNPDIALFRPGTAVPAAGAFKMQPT